MADNLAADMASSPAVDLEARAVAAAPGPLLQFWQAFRENKGAVMGLAVLAIIVFAAVFANVIAPYSPTEQFRDAVKAPPAWYGEGTRRFLLGTDDLGRDMLSRIIYGARVSLFIGMSVMCVSFVIGVLLGLAAAFSNPLNLRRSRTACSSISSQRPRFKFGGNTSAP